MNTAFGLLNLLLKIETIKIYEVSAFLIVAFLAAGASIQAPYYWQLIDEDGLPKYDGL